MYTGYGALGGACALRAVAALGLAPDDGVGEQLVGTRLSRVYACMETSDRPTHIYREISNSTFTNTREKS